MAWVTMETEVSCDLRFIFLTLRLPRPFCWFKKFELARNRKMLSLLVSHTRYRNSHKYLIDLLTSHMIQYSSGYDARFPRKRSWFESQLGNNIFFCCCCCCFLFAFVVFILIFFLFLSLTISTIRQLLHLGIKSHKAVDILYCVQKFSLIMCSHSSCLHNSNFWSLEWSFYVAKHAYSVILHLS